MRRISSENRAFATELKLKTFPWIKKNTVTGLCNLDDNNFSPYVNCRCVVSFCSKLQAESQGHDDDDDDDAVEGFMKLSRSSRGCQMLKEHHVCAQPVWFYLARLAHRAKRMHEWNSPIDLSRRDKNVGASFFLFLSVSFTSVEARLAIHRLARARDLRW